MGMRCSSKDYQGTSSVVQLCMKYMDFPFCTFSQIKVWSLQFHHLWIAFLFVWNVFTYTVQAQLTIWRRHVNKKSCSQNYLWKSIKSPIKYMILYILCNIYMYSNVMFNYIKNKERDWDDIMKEKINEMVNLNNSPFILDITIICLLLSPLTEFFKIYLFTGKHVWLNSCKLNACMMRLHCINSNIQSHWISETHI
jgi:hypothetical protein